MNKEKLEESAENAFVIFQNENPIVPQKHILPFKLGYIEGAKWQQERSYSDEEVLDLLAGFIDSRGKDFVPFKDIQEWFEQFKKK
jgi:hypothetical protein